MFLARAEPPAGRQPEVIRPLLLQPDVARVIVGELDYEPPLVFRQRCRDQLDELLLPPDINGGEQLILVNRLEQHLVLVLALLFGVGKRRDAPAIPVEPELFRAAVGELQQLF